MEIKTTDIENYKKQRSSNPQVINVTSNDEVKKYYVQKSVINGKSNEIFLGPNEVFFNTPGSLKVHQNKNIASTDDWNGKKYFDYIYGIKRVEDKMYWSFITTKFIKNPSLFINMKVYKSCTFKINIDNKKTFIVYISQDTSTNNYVQKIKLGKIYPGLHFLELSLENTKAASSVTTATNKTINNGVGELRYIKLVSAKKKPFYVVRERWRPLAAHTTFYSSKISKNSAWIMGIKKAPPKNNNASLGCFSPLTSPFGYYGAVISANGSSNGVNFSFWSFGRGKLAPPIYKLSRLLAIGSRTGVFGEFTHEGTGVKIRNFNPWTTNKSKNYIVALKFKVEDYDGIHKDGRLITYYSYYWDELYEEWKLFGIGQHFRLNHQIINNLLLKGFVEVPGPPEVQRTNHRNRTIVYKGYVCDLNGKWKPVNRMKNGYFSNKEYSNKKWDIITDKDGQKKFTVTAGGLEQYTVDELPTVLAINESQDDNVPIYMREDKLAVINEKIKHPVIEAHLEKHVTKTLELTVEIPDKDHSHNTVEIYYGQSDGLTILRKWKNKKIFTVNTNGTHVFSIPYDAKNKYHRVLIKDKELQIWSKDTYVI